jgi:hypothetical protein
MSGVLNLLILGIGRTEKNSKNAEPRYTAAVHGISGETDYPDYTSD